MPFLEQTLKFFFLLFKQFGKRPGFSIFTRLARDLDSLSAPVKTMNFVLCVKLYICYCVCTCILVLLQVRITYETKLSVQSCTLTRTMLYLGLINGNAFLLKVQHFLTAT